jgi:hypothetical protein
MLDQLCRGHAEAVRESTVLRIASTVPVRIWSGVGDLLVAADDIEPVDSIYLGGAQLISVPDFQQLMNGSADRLEYTLSGVSAQVLALAREEAAGVRGAALDLGTVRFDEDWQQTGVLTWEERFRCDTLTIGGQPSDKGRTRTITLSVGTDDTGRSRAPISIFTDADQRRRSPTDNYFNQVASITAGTSRRFGPS